MKKIFIVLLLCSNFCFGQSQEAKQLLLNVEKLAQLKLMLSHMKTGYQILEKGYTSIKNISQGNFNLHRDFLDGRLRFTEIAATIERVLEAFDPAAPAGIDDVLEIDRRARDVAAGMLPMGA